MSISAIVLEVRKAAQKYPDRPALIAGEQVITYAELERRMAGAATIIGKRVQGRTIAMLYTNTPSFAEVFLGALWAGKSVAVLPTLAPPPLIKLMAMEAGAQVVAASQDVAPRLTEAQVPHWTPETLEVDPATVPMQELAQETAVLLYTSGTTGRPKTVALSEQNILDNAEGCRLSTGFDDGQVMLAILPLFHAYGLTISMLLPLTTGSRVVIPERFVPRAVLQTIERHKITCLVAVPSQYRLFGKTDKKTLAATAG